MRFGKPTEFHIYIKGNGKGCDAMDVGIETLFLDSKLFAHNIRIFAC